MVKIGMKNSDLLKRGWVKWGLIFAGWTLFGFFFASQVCLYEAYMGRPVTWGRALAVWLTCSYIWAAQTPFILALAGHFRLNGSKWLQSLLVHLPASILFAVIHLGTEVFMNLAIIGVKPGERFSLIEAFEKNFITEFHSDLIVYWAIIGASHAAEYYQKYHERELKASQLEARLAQSQLQVLKMQLHPHFLFNTLHAISALMHKDVEAADRMIARLSDLLRMTLENVGVQLVPLQQELELLKRYIEIEETRFRDRLTVHMRIDSEALDAQVPNLILQPLVENAIRHGIAPRLAAGRVEVSARRKYESLHLQVRDNGCGLSKNRKEGIGLANTRARLWQLYGAKHHFVLSSNPDGGLTVTLVIPFCSAADYAADSEMEIADEYPNANRR